MSAARQQDSGQLYLKAAKGSIPSARIKQALVNLCCSRKGEASEQLKGKTWEIALRRGGVKTRDSFGKGGGFIYGRVFLCTEENWQTCEDTYWQRTWKRGKCKVESFQICSWSAVNFQSELWDVVKDVKKFILVEDFDLTWSWLLGEETVLLTAGFIYELLYNFCKRYNFLWSGKMMIKINSSIKIVISVWKGKYDIYEILTSIIRLLFGNGLDWMTRKSKSCCQQIWNLPLLLFVVFLSLLQVIAS